MALHVLLLQSKPETVLHFKLFLFHLKRTNWCFGRNYLKKAFHQEVWLCVPPLILNVKTKKGSHQEKARQETKDIGRGEGEVRDRRQGSGSSEEGFVVSNPLLSFSSPSLWLSGSLPCTALSNVSRKQVRQSEDETSDCMRECRKGGA